MMRRPAYWSRATWFGLPRGVRKNERTLQRWSASYLKRIYAPQAKDFVRSLAALDHSFLKGIPATPLPQSVDPTR